MKEPYTRIYPPSIPRRDSICWLLFLDGNLVVCEEFGNLFLPTQSNLPSSIVPLNPVYLANSQDASCLADELSHDTALPEGWQAVSLRDAYGRLSEDDYHLAGYALEILYWRKTSKHCPVCGRLTVQKNGDWGRECTNCGHIGYPRVSPAVLILVHDETRILLAHKPGWGTRYSILAGFVEPGESLEECVHREVHEEAGVELGDLTYFGSQPWPYPHQLMVGFMAKYSGGEITLEDDELDDAAWFTPATMPDLPPAVSLSRRMIDHWLLNKA